MFQQIFKPHSALAGFVNNIMIHEFGSESQECPSQFSIPPLPENGIIFYLGDLAVAQNASTGKSEILASSIVVGPQVYRQNITVGRKHVMVRVGFQPGGLYRLSGIPMNELLCRDAFESREIFGSEISEIQNRLMEADSYAEIKTILEYFLIKRISKLKQELPIDIVLPRIIKERGLIKIDRLASEACLSTRQFERVFQQRVGLSPKHFSRLVRFAQAWIIKQKQPTKRWTSIAHECGYFDQMHLIRDFQEFAGANPSTIEQEISVSRSFLVQLSH